MKTRSTRRRSPAKALSLLLLTLALAMVLAVAACESDDDPTATPGSGGSDSGTEQSSSSTDSTGTDSTGTDSTPTDSSGDSGMDGDPLAVVTTTNIVADWVRNVGGDRVEVMSLLPVGGDPHTYQPGARDVANIVDADLVLTVGLGLEGAWLEELIHNASADESRIVALAGAIDPIEFAETGGHEGEEEHAELRGRLLIADRDQPALSVLNLIEEDLAELSLEVAAPAARLYSSPSGRFAFALARGPRDAGLDRVHIFDGGIYLEEHEGHMDLEIEPVSRLTLETTDQRPVHVSVHNGWTSIFHDGSGRVAFFEEHDLEDERNDYEPIWMEAGLQHGAGVALGEEFFMVTSNNPDYPGTATSSLPLGGEIRDASGAVVYSDSSRACPGMHGEAANHDGVLLGCVGGVLFIEGHDGEYEHDFIENPAEMNTAARIGTVWGHEDAANFFGSASYRHEGESVYDGLWLIDAEGGEMMQVLPSLEEKRVLSVVWDAHGEEIFALAYDGTLNVIEAETGELLETVELLPPFDADTSPSIMAVAGLLYISDRAGGRIIEYSLEDGEIEREWPIGGQPGSLAFVGVGAAQDFEAHDHGPLDPHFWFDPTRVREAVIDIATRLAIMDPAGAETYTANATAYVAQLEELHAWTEQQVAEIPVDNRILVTSHDSLSYFAVVYGFEVVGTVIPGGTTETESSAEQLAHLIETIEHEGVSAVFGETTITERIAQTVAEETGAGFYSLYSGSLGAVGSGADTFITMVRTNVEIIVEALS